jgi:hypothetical protein
MQCSQNREIAARTRSVWSPKPQRKKRQNMTDAERFRQKAEEARAMAAKVLSPLDKEAWLELAEDWLKMALITERRESLQR